MKKKRPTYSNEFKLETANLVAEEGYTVTEAATAMQVSQTAVRKWVNQLQQEHCGVTPPGAALTAEQQKIKELEKRIQRLELEKDILKKASALLMSDSLPGIRS